MRGSPWLPSHTATLERMAGRVPDREIAEMVGHPRVVVTRHRNDLGLPACYRVNWSRMSARFLARGRETTCVTPSWA